MKKIIGQSAVLEEIELSAERDLPALLIGETGVGKTSMVRYVAEKNKKKCVRFNLNGETTVDEFVGRWTLVNGQTVYQEGILIEALRNGWWIVVDEINSALPEILFTLHPLLDDDKFIMLSNKDNEIVKPHKDFRFFGTMNPCEEYSGTKDMNKAFMSRFPIVIEVDYPNKNDEVEIIKQKGEVKEETARMMVDVGLEIRKRKEKEELYYSCSTRDLIQWGKLSKNFDINRSFILSVLNKASKEERSKIFDILNSTVKQYSSFKEVLKTDWKINKISDTKSLLSEMQEIDSKFRQDLEIARQKGEN